MKLLATAEVMREFDRIAVERYGIPGLVLMENAGRCCVEELTGAFGNVTGKQIAVVCGKGNNGGDGFVIARHLLNRNALVDVLLLAPPAQLTGDSAANYRILRNLARGNDSGLRLIRFSRSTGRRQIKNADIVVDAIFGTGFAGIPRGIARDAIRWINSFDGPVVAVDVPSGISASTGEAAGDAVRAALTVTMACDKIGLRVGRGRELSGAVRVVDISIPAGAMVTPGRPTYRIEESDVRSLLPRRPLTAHKYSVGKVLVIAGSRSYTGAPALASLAALKSGAGAVNLCVPASLHGMMVRKLTDVIITPCPETGAGTLGSGALEELEKKLSWADVVVLGPGLGRHEETDALVRKLVGAIASPLILDADGLNAVAGHLVSLRRRPTPAILTPHTGELARLLGGDSAALERLRVEAGREAAQCTSSIVVLKGAPTVTAFKNKVGVNASGNPGMATIGSGDVLSGIIAGLIGQGVSVFEAAYAGVFLHGRAGDIAARAFGERSILATDILAHIPSAFKEAEQ